ncbi:MAG: L-lysine 6-transaminase [Myxococcales bacterium]|nr:L-lysine 6-transaminase [Myxococcales bacterium]
MKADRNQALEPREVIDALASHRLQIAPTRFVLDWEESRGSFLVDKVTGRRYLDLFTFYASNPVGMNHPVLDDPRFDEAIRRVSRFKPSNPDIYSVEFAEFVETFARVALPDAFSGLFFVDGGALAVENALKAAFDWKVRKNLAAGLGERGQKVVHFRQAFHGRSGYTLSLTNTHDPRKHQYFPKFDWPRLENPKLRFPLDDHSLAAVAEAEARVVGELERLALEQGPDLAAIIIEPIQGEGGDNHFRPEFLAELRRIADEHEMMLIFDEVQTGLGLTGSWWAFEQLGVVPDLLVFGKKSQICGFASTDRIDEVENVFTVPSRISSTFGGNVVDMVRATWFLRIIEEEGLVSNAQDVGAAILSGLESLASRFPQISNVRGRGLMIAFDLPTSAERDRFRATMLELGCFILPSGEQSIRFRPQLGLTRDEGEMALDLLEQAIHALF